MSTEPEYFSHEEFLKILPVLQLVEIAHQLLERTHFLCGAGLQSALVGHDDAPADKTDDGVALSSRDELVERLEVLLATFRTDEFDAYFLSHGGTYAS